MLKMCIYNSSRNDFNPVLARQPRASIDMPKFEPPRSLHVERPSNPFSVSILYKSIKMGEL